MTTASQPNAAPVSRRVVRELLPLVALVLALHLALRAALPTPRLWGDENHYVALASEDVERGRSSLLPGALAFDHRPQLASRVFSLGLAQPEFEDRARAFAPLERIQIGLAVLVVALTWMQAVLLGLRRTAALVAGAYVGLHPWLGFHAHALWPEMLHALFFGSAFTCLLAYSKDRRLRWLLPAGLATGYAILAKGTLVPFVPALGIFVAFVGARGAGRGALRALAAGGLFLACVLAVALPQALENESQGHGIRLAANRWWNLELGLTPAATIDPAELEWQRERGLASGSERWLPSLQTSLNYFAAADTPSERERLARERTLRHVRERGVLGSLADQVPKFARLFLRPDPAFEQALAGRQRWGESPPTWLAALVVPARIAWWSVMALAAVGIALTLRRGAAWGLVALFALYMLGALFLVPVKFRFVLPLVPTLALLAAATLDAWLARCARGRIAVPDPVVQAASPDDSTSRA